MICIVCNTAGGLQNEATLQQDNYSSEAWISGHLMIYMEFKHDVAQKFCTQK